MKILVTGAKGFVGKNLVWTLKNIKEGKDKSFPISVSDVYEVDRETNKEDIKAYTKDCDYIVHLAGVNRPSDNDFSGNKSSLDMILEGLKENNNKCGIILSSSIQANRGNAYGDSKIEAENYLKQFSKDNGNKVYIYRFPNIFGKWCKPNYNSVVATWCYNIARDLPIQVNDESASIRLVYIDDVVACIIDTIVNGNDKCYVHAKPTFTMTLKDIRDKLYEFHDQRDTLIIPKINSPFVKRLYSTYISYLPEDKMKIELKSNVDDRGSFTEIIKSYCLGQFSVNISKPGITKGEHWHNSKWEFFLVVKGKALIEERLVGSDEVIKFEVSGDKLEMIHMCPGYTHNIINLSDTEELITLMWANEMFDKNKSDTFSMPV